MSLKHEYKSLGETLRALTIKDIADKFDVPPSTVTSLFKITPEDIYLIKQLCDERKKMINRRKEIRTITCNYNLYN